MNGDILYHRGMSRSSGRTRQGDSPDQPGSFIAWLRRVPVARTVFGGWFDIGNDKGAQCRHLGDRQGMPRREEYSL